MRKEEHPVLKWFAIVTTLVGAVLTSLALDPYNIYFLNIGTALFLYWSVKVQDRGLIVVNAGILIIYIGGMIRSIFW